MAGFGKPIHKPKPFPICRYWLNCVLESGEEYWISITIRDWRRHPSDQLGIDRNEGEARFRAVQIFARLSPCPESAYLFPPGTEPEEPEFKDVLDHFQATPFTAMGTGSKQIDVEELEKTMGRVLARARR